MKHPFRGDRNLHRKTYEVVCNKVRKFYGVLDAEKFFQARRTAILNQCEQDEFGWAKYGSLLEWHEAVILAERMSPNAAIEGPEQAQFANGPARMEG